MLKEIVIVTGRKGLKIINNEFEKLFKKSLMKSIVGWVFTYNDFTKNWQAARREDAKLLFNDINNPLVIKSKDINTLIEILIRTDGSPEKFKPTSKK